MKAALLYQHQEPPCALPLTPYPEQVEACLAYLRLAANPLDDVAMSRAINTPARRIGFATQAALEEFAFSARRLLPGITVPECLMSLLEDEHLDELEKVQTGADERRRAVETTPLLQEDMLDGEVTEVTVWPEESGGGDDGNVAALPSHAGGEGGAGESDGWGGFSVARARALRKAAAEPGDEVKWPTKLQAKTLRVFAQMLCNLRVTSATRSVRELLDTVLEDTEMRK